MSRTFVFQTKGGGEGVDMKGKSQGGQTAGRRQSQHDQGATGQVLRPQIEVVVVGLLVVVVVVVA